MTNNENNVILLVDDSRASSIYSTKLFEHSLTGLINNNDRMMVGITSPFANMTQSMAACIEAINKQTTRFIDECTTELDEPTKKNKPKYQQFLPKNKRRW